MDSLISGDSGKNVIVEARRLAREFRAQGLTRPQMLALCMALLRDAAPRADLHGLWLKLSKLPTDERHYWIGTFYTLLLPQSERSAQAAYFTPPHLARGLIESVQKQGFDLRTHTVIDPAAGGASFLSTIAGAMLRAGADATGILPRLKGYEIDPNLSSLAEALISNRLSAGVTPRSIVEVRDSLNGDIVGIHDLVIANPPFGRIAPSDLSDERWREVCHPGHLNKYALFTELCLRLAKKDGLVALVLPSSFVAGPLYGRLRSHIRSKGEILSLSTVTHRDDIFVDVAQDVSVLIVKTGAEHRIGKLVAFGTYAITFKVHSTSPLPEAVDGPWISPGGTSPLVVGGATLADYGAVLRSGYFVWNREGSRMLKRRYRKLDLPLIWARNISAGGFCKPEARKRSGVDFVRFEEESAAIVRGDALLLQRTTNSSQPRRLIAARVSPSVIKKWGGFVSENHTITITGPNVHVLNALSLLLNSAAVDERYRLLSGTASVSVKLLRGLDLPLPAHLAEAIAKYGETETAVVRAYAKSADTLRKVGT